VKPGAWVTNVTKQVLEKLNPSEKKAVFAF